MIQPSVESGRQQELAPSERRNTGFANFAAVASNLGAIEAGMRFAQATTQFVAVIGAPGWGKSHLIESVATYMQLQGLSVNRPMPASLYASNPERADESLPLILDDVQDAWTNLRSKQQLRRLLERRVKGRRSTLVTFSGSVGRKSAAGYLPGAREWGFQAIEKPTKAERDLIVRQIADHEGVVLSKPIVALVSRHLCGNGRSIQGALHTLKLSKADWSRRDDACEACGALMPYIHGEDGWDPRDVVAEVVSGSFTCQGVEGVTQDQVCAYILISCMGLSEYDVSTFLGVSPTRAYAMNNGVKLQLADHRLAQCVQVCRDAIVRSLDADSC